MPSLGARASDDDMDSEILFQDPAIGAGFWTFLMITPQAETCVRAGRSGTPVYQALARLEPVYYAVADTRGWPENLTKPEIVAVLGQARLGEDGRCYV